MTYKQDARDFISIHGIEKSERIAKCRIGDFYSEKTGSYYATSKNNSVSIKHLLRAIIEYKELIEAEANYRKLKSEFRGIK